MVPGQISADLMDGIGYRASISPIALVRRNANWVISSLFIVLGPFAFRLPGLPINRLPRFSGRGGGLRAIRPSSAGRAVARFRSWPGKLPD